MALQLRPGTVLGGRAITVVKGLEVVITAAAAGEAQELLEGMLETDLVGPGGTAHLPQLVAPL